VAPAFVYGDILDEVEVRTIDASEVESELARLHDAIALVKKELLRDTEQVTRELGQDKADIFLVHSMILEDKSVLDAILDAISSGHVNAEAAVAEEVKRLVAALSSSDDRYLRDRAYDVSDIGKRVIERMLGVWAHCPLSQPMILVARELRASDTASMERGRILGFVTELGGTESHAAILARSLGVPAMAGVEGILERVRTGEIVAMDGCRGVAVVDPSDDTRAHYERLREEEARERQELASVLELPSVTRDGTEIALMSNVGSSEEARQAAELGSDGIGLLRSEMVFMSAKLFLDEDAQFEIYRGAVEAVAGRPVSIRTLDVGGDKFVTSENPLHEHNPNLGYRSTRVLLDRPDLLLAQFRAILRASAHGAVRVLIPMISSVEELRETKARLEEAKSQLRLKGVAFDENIKTGVMIEIPSAAMVADRLADECDFLSIGTNDLVQYTLAVDRGSSYVSRLYRPHDPSVLALIARSVEGAASAGKPISLCGEMAGTPAYVPLLIGLGLREFSVSNSRLPRTKKAIRDVDLDAAILLANEAVAARTAGDVAALLGLDGS
ncbi:MAG: phosphoenolpyruvate--protein phosphotransferase, partial [Candidatus Eisenbacteria sp.]|nr:phosphoenolpyruvate--protein phosphotransferase [Candidatus Eisenbacteria bacterium]